VELRECDATVEFVLRTDTGEFTSGGVILEPGDRRIWWEGLTVHDHEEQQRRVRLASALYLMLAAVIRDFLVVEEREHVFGTAKPSVLPTRSRDTDSPRIVYLPRVRYVGKADIVKCRTDLALTRRPSAPSEVRGCIG
jgi:hypothetical protein